MSFKLTDGHVFDIQTQGIFRVKTIVALIFLYYEIIRNLAINSLRHRALQLQKSRNDLMALGFNYKFISK